MENKLSKLLIKQILSFSPYYLGAIICLIITHFIQSYLPFYAKELADLITVDISKISVEKFLWMALGIIIFRTSSRLLFFYPARVMEKNLRLKILQKLENTNPSRYQQYSSGQLFQILSNDLQQIRALVGFVFLQLGNIIIASAILIPRILAFNPHLLKALLPMFTGTILFTIIVNKNRSYYRKNQDQQGEVQNFIIESYMGKPTIKNYHAEESFINLFKDHCAKELWYFYQVGRSLSLSRPLIPLGVGISLLWGAYIIRDLNLGMSALILFSGFAFLLLEPLMFISWVGIVCSRALASWERIKELINSVKDISEKEKNLLFMNPHITSPNEENNCFNVNFWKKEITIPIVDKGWTVIISKTGHGKTEVLRQIADILKVRNEKVAYIAQNPYLYNDNIQNNIFLGNPITKEKLDYAYNLLSLFGLSFLAANQEQLMKLEIGENGKRLSGGQAKRVCLVRSLMTEADFFIWDDPFSAIDTLLEKKITSLLKTSPELLKKTFLLSTHRISTVQSSDQVIFIDKVNGIEEQGSTNILLNTNSKTYEHFKDQLV